LQKIQLFFCGDIPFLCMPVSNSDQLICTVCFVFFHFSIVVQEKISLIVGSSVEIFLHSGGTETMIGIFSFL
jgi:hypothetical protein